MKNKHDEIVSLSFCALMSALISVVSQITIPTPFGIPITFQTFAISLCGFLLGTRHGLVSVTVYIALGVVGMPVFTGFRGGFSVVFGEPTGGFIIGFIPLAAICGVKKYIYWKKHGKLLSVSLGILGIIVCHLCGVILYSTITNVGFFASVAVASLPFILKDIISCFLAYLISCRLLSILNKIGYKL